MPYQNLRMIKRYNVFLLPDPHLEIYLDNFEHTKMLLNMS